MRSYLVLLPMVLCGLARADEAIDLRQVREQMPKLQVETKVRQPGRVAVTVQNPSAQATAIRVERGTVFTGLGDRARLVALRSARVEVGAAGSAEMSVPAVALSARKLAPDQSFATASEAAPGLDPLLDYFASNDDVPTVTAQLLVLCVTEDIGLAGWRSFLAAERSAPDAASLPTQEDIAAAIDVLGVLKKLFPQRLFALASDAELKLRALRNPISRPKAMQLYGLALPEAAPLPPELGTLLHTKAGDNCPICRQRALMQPREDGL